MERKAREILRKKGINGNWYGKNAFSSHRNLERLPKASDNIVPYPDEFLLLVDTFRSTMLTDDDEFHDFSKEHKGDYYWNYRVYKFKGRKWSAFIHLLYGDEADMEHVKSVIDATKEMFVK